MVSLEEKQEVVGVIGYQTAWDAIPLEMKKSLLKTEMRRAVRDRLFDVDTYWNAIKGGVSP